MCGPTWLGLGIRAYALVGGCHKLYRLCGPIDLPLEPFFNWCGPLGGSIETECCGCRSVDGGMRHASSSRRQRKAESDFLLPPALKMADGRVNSPFVLWSNSKPVPS